VSTVLLREMSLDDMPSVMALERELFPEDAWTPEMFIKDLTEPGVPSRSRYLVAVDELAADQEALIGYAGMLFAGGPEADVLTLAVAPGRWGGGIGTALLEALLGQARERACAEVFLEVRADNPRARGLYLRHGFVEVGVRKAYYQPSGTDAIVMRKDLNK
jgi:[ribosomal protein S18]-alanine N-acetyltransferase